MHAVSEPGEAGSPPAGSGPLDDAARLRSLLDIAKVIGAARRFDDLIELSADSARRALDAASLSISRWDRENGVLRTLVNVGVLSPGERRFPADETYSLVEWPDMTALVAGRSFVSSADDGSADGEFLQAMGKDSAMSVPILVEGRMWGELWAARGDPQHRFTEADIAFAEAVATQIAAGVVQADHLARVERLAFTDPLTGLANRRAVDERLHDVLGEGAPVAQPVSIVLADINRLKQVNDTFGHEAGDRLIVAMAEAVSRASGLAQDSLAARIGGDEFCVLVVGEPLAVAVRVAEELCRQVDAQPMSTGVSCGVASTDVLAGPVDSPVRLFRLADAAQYRAKRAGLRHPVVAGRAAPDGPVEAPADRRARRGRLSTDVPAALESGLALLDAMAPADARQRLERVADHLCDLLDAAGWWVSRVADGSDQLVTLSSSVERSGVSSGEQLRSALLRNSAAGPGKEAPDPAPSALLRNSAAGHYAAEVGGFAAMGTVFDLESYPVTRRAIEQAGSFFVEAGMPGNDPAEEATLVTAGYMAVLGAGAHGEGCGWLVEIYADPISLPMGGFEPVLRALVAVAVAGAASAPAVPRQTDR